MDPMPGQLEQILQAAQQQGPPQPVGPDWSKRDPEDMVVPINLSGGRREEVISFLDNELQRSTNYVKMIHSQARKYREQYAEYRHPKSFPWEKCSNIAVPMTAPFVNQVVGRNMRVLRATDPPILVEALPDAPAELQNSDLLGKIEQLINSRLFKDPTLFQAIFEWCLDATIVGTGLAEVYWECKRHTGRRFEFDPMTGKPTPIEEEVIDFEGATIVPFRIEDFWMPAESFDDPNALQNAQWVARRHFERWGVALKKGREGKYDMDSLMKLKGKSDQTDPGVKKQSTYIDPSTRSTGTVEAPQSDSANELVLYTIHCRYAIDGNDGNGEEKDCIFTYSQKHKEIIRAVYNPSFSGKRPFVAMRYWPLSNSFLGRGIPDQVKHPQQASDDTSNAAIDALTLGNTPLIVSGKQVGLKPGKNDRIWPGRWITLDDPQSFQQVKLNGPNEQSTQFLSFYFDAAQRASGVSDGLIAAETGQGNRETAEGALARMGIASPMFDITLDQIRHALEEVSEQFLTLYQQFSPESVNFLNDGMMTSFELPTETTLAGKLRFRLVASSSSANPEIRKTTLQQLLATTQPLFLDLSQMATALSDKNTPPGAREIMKRAFVGKYQLGRALLKAFDMPAVDDILKPWAEFAQGKPNPDGSPGTPGFIQATEDAYSQSQQQPPELSEPIQRHVYPNFQQLTPEEQLYVVGTLMKLPPGDQRKQLAELEKQNSGQSAPAPGLPGQDGGGPPNPFGAPGGGMGGPGAGGQGGPGFPPPNMPPFPFSGR